MNSLRAGDRLRELRLGLGITTRDVENLSQRIAEEEDNPEFQISNPRLTQIENSDTVPSVFKLYSLAVIYHVKFTELLLYFGVDLEKSAHHRLLAPLPNTHLTTLEVYDDEKAISFPVRFDRSFDLDNTNLLARMVETWGEVPIAMLQKLDLRHSLYGYIGLKDYTLYPLLRPGSFVQIDQRVRKVNPFRWRTEFDRPVYFVELREGYACGWCELQETRLLLLPHPLSPCSVRQLEYGKEAEIIGQVTGVAMRLTGWFDSGPDGNSRLPMQS